MFRHSLGLYKRRAHIAQRQDGTDDLPASIGNPTATLPAQIGPSDISSDPSATADIVTAEAPSGYTTITETQTLAQSVTGQGIISTITTERTRTITNSAEYASLTSAEALSSATTTRPTTSAATTSATNTAAPQKSSSNLSTLVPAIVVPVVVLLLVSLGVFWFFMRRRHRREVQSQPEFVMAGRGEKLSSRSSSHRSAKSDPWVPEKKLPMVTQTEAPSSISPPTAASEWPTTQIGVARPLTPKESISPSQSRLFDQPRSGTTQQESRPYRNFSGPGPRTGPHPEMGAAMGSGPRPPTAGRPGPPPSNGSYGQYRSRSNSSPGQRGPPNSSRPGPGPAPRIAPSPVPRNGPSPTPQHFHPAQASQSLSSDSRPVQGLPSDPRPAPLPPAAVFRLREPSPTMNHNARAQAPSRLQAPPPGAYNGASSISQYSPIVKDTPNIQRPAGAKRTPPPIQTSDLARKKGVKSPSSGSPPGNGLTEENLRIARFANSSRLGYTPAEPSPSPKLPPPATRSQLIPRESPQESQERFFGSGGSESMPQGLVVPSFSHVDDRHDAHLRASIVSDPDEYEDIAAKSDVSSLNEFDRFDFGEGIGSARGSTDRGSMNFFAPNNGSSRPRGNTLGQTQIHERW